MKSKVEVYKGVKLIEGRTKEVIDYVIEERKKTNKPDCKAIAELFGFKSFRSITIIIRSLNSNEKPEQPKAPKYIIKTAKNTYSNYYGKKKDKARSLIAEFIMSTKRQSSNILTLPADEFIMEKQILNQKNGYKFTAVERDKETFQKMIINAGQNQIVLDSIINYHNLTIGEVIENAKEDTYSSAILDYCGFVDSFLDEINDMMKRNLVKKGGFITITLTENDRAINNPLQISNYTNAYINACYSGQEVNGNKVTTDLIQHTIFNNREQGYKLVKKFDYKDTKSKMMLFVIQRVNN